MPPGFAEPPHVAQGPNASTPLAAVLRFSAIEPVRTTVHVSDGEREWTAHFDETHDPAQGLALLGMRPGRLHHINVAIEDASGTLADAPATLVFTIPLLPPAPVDFPPIQANVPAPERVEPGVKLLSVRRSQRGNPEFGLGYGLLLALDAQGQPVWYHHADAQISDMERLRNGNLLYLTADFRAVEIDMLGNVVTSWYAAGRPQGPAPGIPVDASTFHHDIAELPSGNLMVLGTVTRQFADYWASETDPWAPRRPAMVLGDEVIEFDREGRVVWRWNTFDHLDPYRIGYQMFATYWAERGLPGAMGWTHGNGFCYDARDDSLILSLRTQDAVIKIDRATGEIRWILGEPTDWSERLRHRLLSPLGKMRWFYHQHAPTLTPRGTLLLFDNGSYRARPFSPAMPMSETYSRVVEYEIDEARMTVRQVWASEGPGPDAVLAYFMGDAQWMPQSGNVLASYGGCVAQGIPEMTMENARQWPLWTRAREMIHADPTETVWEVILSDSSLTDPISWAIYGAKHLPNL